METPVHVLVDEKGTDITTVSPGTTVAEAVHILNKENIGAVIVMEADKLVGLFSERDVLRRVVEHELDIHKTTVSKVMTTKVIVLSPISTVGEAMKLITEKRCRHLPMMEGDKVVGMISSGDLTRHLAKDQERHISELVNYISGGY